VQLAISHRPTSDLVNHVFRNLPAKERKRVENKIAAVTDTNLTTAVRPFMFGGKVVHELYFDTSKLLFFIREEKIGAIVSAFAISSFPQNAEVPLSDQSLITHAEQIIRYGKRLKYENEISAFLGRLRTLEDEWSRDSFGDLSDQAHPQSHHV
jgi:hypothetical protein